MAAVSTTEHVKWFHVDVELIPAKLSYFFVAARLAYQPFILIFLNEIGLDTQKAGLINGLHYLGFLFGGPIIAFIADHYKCHHKVARITILLGLLFMILAPMSGVLLSKAPTNVCPADTVNRNATITDNMSDKRENILFFLVLLLFTLASMFGDGIRGFVDFATLQKTLKYDNFSHQILYRSFGWPFSVFLSGIFVDHFPTSKITCFSGVFITVILNTIGLAVSVELLLKGVVFEEKHENKEYTSINGNNEVKLSTFETLKKTLKEPNYIFLFLTVSIIGVLQGIYFNFYFFYFKDIGTTTTYMTLYSAGAGLFCVIGYAFFNKFLELAKDTWNIFLITALANALRCLLFGISTNIYLVYTTVTLQSFNVVFNVAVVRYVKKECDFEIQTTILNITNALRQAFGYVLANIVGGAIYKIYGKDKLFLSGVVLAVFWFFIMLVVVIFRYCRKDKKEYETIL